MNVETEAIILKTQKYKEYDEIITAFTKKYGKIRMFARSSKRLKSPLLSGTQIFSYSNLTIDLRDSGTRLFEAKLEKSFYELSYDLGKYYLASYICESVDKFSQENQTDGRFFDRILNIFKNLSKTKNIKLFRIIYELYLVESMGLRSQMNECGVCGNKDINLFNKFDIAQSNIVCSKCNINTSHIKKIDPNMIKFFTYVYKYSMNSQRLLDIQITNKLLDKSDDFIKTYIEYHLGKIDLKSLDILKEEEKNYDNT